MVDRPDPMSVLSCAKGADDRRRLVIALDAIPAPAPDCTDWRQSPNGVSQYRWFDGRHGLQVAYCDGRVMILDLR